MTSDEWKFNLFSFIYLYCIYCNKISHKGNGKENAIIFLIISVTKLIHGDVLEKIASWHFIVTRYPPNSYIRVIICKRCKMCVKFSGRRRSCFAESGTAYDRIFLPRDNQRTKTHDWTYFPRIRCTNWLLEAVFAFPILHKQPLCQYVCSVYSGGNFFY